MGNIRLVFVALGTVLFLIVPNHYAQAQSCERIFLETPPSKSQSLTRNKKLKIATWNLLNFKIARAEDSAPRTPGLKDRLAQKYSNVTYMKEREERAKTESELQIIKKVMEDLNADIFVFQEVAGIKSLKYFMKNYMNDKYVVYYKEDLASPHGFQIAFAIKRTLGVAADIESSKDLSRQDLGNRALHIFKRDFPILYVRDKDDSQIRPNKDPKMIIIGAHFKSKIDSPGDPESHHLRTAQIEASVQVIKKLDDRLNHKVSMMLAADANTDVHSGEIESTKDLLQDSMDVAGVQSTEQRVTHTFHPHDGPMSAHQYDTQMINKVLATKLVDSYVYHYKSSDGKDKTYVDRNGVRKPYPQSFEQRQKNVSDHMPVVAIYDMTR